MSLLSDANATRWAKATVKPEKRAIFKSVAQRLSAPAAKARYTAIEKKTGVPWFVIAVIHEREASQKWSANIAQGDPWDRVSRNVPAGRGPFKSFEEAAYDALMKCAPYAGKWTDWSVGGTLELLERYNGLGYAAKKVPSPYIWSGTDRYVSGKYIRDHVYDANAVDQQLGCAGLILAMQELDPSIKFGKPTAAEKPKVTAERAVAAVVLTAGGAATVQQAQTHGLSGSEIAWMIAAFVVLAIASFMVVCWIKRSRAATVPPSVPLLPEQAPPEAAVTSTSDIIPRDPVTGEVDDPKAPV
jgi:lysozyme family protein